MGADGDEKPMTMHLWRCRAQADIGGWGATQAKGKRHAWSMRDEGARRKPMFHF